MTVGQAVVWASQNIDPKYQNPELTTSEPYVMGSHATCSGAWVSGPEDLSPPEYFWGYNRMTTVEGLFWSWRYCRRKRSQVFFRFIHRRTISSKSSSKIYSRSKSRRYKCK